MLNGGSRLNIGRDFVMNGTTGTNTTQANGTAVIDVGRDIVFLAASSGASGVDRNNLNTNTNATLIMRGNLVNPGMGHYEMYGNSTLSMSGTSAQFMPSLIDSWRSFPNVIINNTSATGVGLAPKYDGNYYFTVTQNINFQQGKLNTGNTLSGCGGGNRFIIGAAATISSSPGSYATGGIRKDGNTPFSIPLGDGSNSSILDINNIVGGSATSNIQMQYVASSAGNNTSTDGTLDHVSGKEYWQVLSCGTAITSADATFRWNDACFSDITDVSGGASQDLFMAGWNGTTSKWDKISSSTILGGSQPCVPGGSNETGGIVASGITSFGKFSFGSAGNSNSLPVELISWKATYKKVHVSLDWSTASELNNDFFKVEHSINGESFAEIGRIDGAGTSRKINQYQFIHYPDQHGMQYYRLQQVDYDGSNHYSPIVAVHVEVIDNPLHIYPNPAIVDGSISFDEKRSIVITDVASNIVLKVDKTDKVNVSGLKAGVYFVRCESGKVTKLLIQ